MQKSKLIKGRKGFTLVEVALAVAVGLIVIGGAIVGFNAVRENASNSSARQKVDAAVGIVENLAAANNQIYPASNTTTFGNTWKAQRTDWNANPWGGANMDSDATSGDGVSSWAPMDFGSATQLTAPATTATVAAPTAGTTDGAGNLIYVTANATSQWGTVADIQTGTAVNKVAKGYIISLYSKGGQPFWYVKGGN